MQAVKPVSALRLAGSLLYVGVWPALVFVLAGDATWLEGWLFAGWFMGLCTTVILWLYRKDPALLAERYRRPGSGGQSAGDQAIVYALAVGFAGWIVVMPLDARRFGWTSRSTDGRCAIASCLSSGSAAKRMGRLVRP
jgi:hypothetical protein